ncbi:hypothetical protein SCHPADRAFT_946311 [Schizopora paradoxa]|uniref:Uncharacterized protein n=1 Tax=Schizopora paradoxa TaxID=27342 RepID=A0A0H2RMW7_9AGAM|nr:hypothetical protein SCHPADRAFT_946311 [Schizopora paradoxa]
MDYPNPKIKSTRRKHFPTGPQNSYTDYRNQGQTMPYEVVDLAAESPSTLTTQHSGQIPQSPELNFTLGAAPKTSVDALPSTSASTTSNDSTSADNAKKLLASISKLKRFENVTSENLLAYLRNDSQMESPLVNVASNEVGVKRQLDVDEHNDSVDVKKQKMDMAEGSSDK